jgi:hypothetical protein
MTGEGLRRCRHPGAGGKLPGRGSSMALRMAWLGVAVLLPLAAVGQEQKAESRDRIEYEKKTVINFDDDTIQGDLTRPDGEYVEARKKVSHSNLIKIREEWRDKVKQAAADM